MELSAIELEELAQSGIDVQAQQWALRCPFGSVTIGVGRTLAPQLGGGPSPMVTESEGQPLSALDPAAERAAQQALSALDSAAERAAQQATRQALDPAAERAAQQALSALDPAAERAAQQALSALDSAAERAEKPSELAARPPEPPHIPATVASFPTAAQLFLSIPDSDFPW